MRRVTPRHRVQKDSCLVLLYIYAYLRTYTSTAYLLEKYIFVFLNYRLGLTIRFNTAG